MRNCKKTCKTCGKELDGDKPLKGIKKRRKRLRKEAFKRWKRREKELMEEFKLSERQERKRKKQAKEEAKEAAKRAKKKLKEEEKERNHKAKMEKEKEKEEKKEKMLEIKDEKTIEKEEKKEKEKDMKEEKKKEKEERKQEMKQNRKKHIEERKEKILAARREREEKRSSEKAKDTNVGDKAPRKEERESMSTETLGTTRTSQTAESEHAIPPKPGQTFRITRPGKEAGMESSDTERGLLKPPVLPKSGATWAVTEDDSTSSVEEYPLRARAAGEKRRLRNASRERGNLKSVCDEDGNVTILVGGRRGNRRRSVRGSHWDQDVEGGKSDYCSFVDTCGQDHDRLGDFDEEIDLSDGYNETSRRRNYFDESSDRSWSDDGYNARRTVRSSDEDSNCVTVKIQFMP